MSADLFSWLVLLAVSFAIGLAYLIFQRPAVVEERYTTPLVPILCLPVGDLSFDCDLYQSLALAEQAEAQAHAESEHSAVADDTA